MVIYKLGDVIAECLPFAHCVTREDKETRCHYCLEMRPLKKCSKCKVAHYCSPKCQAQDWKDVHKSECKIFKKDAMMSKSVLFTGDNIRLTLRCLLIVNKNPEKADQPFETYFGPKSFSSLMSHVENNFVESSERLRYVLDLINIFEHYGVQGDAEQIKDIYGKVIINGYGIADEYFNHAGQGLYIGCAVFNHSCMSNTSTDFEGLKLRIGAIREFNTEIEPPSVCYIDERLPWQERQSLLKNHYFFTCQCIRCLNPDDHQLDTNLKQQRQEYEWFMARNDPNYQVALMKRYNRYRMSKS